MRKRRMIFIAITTLMVLACKFSVSEQNTLQQPTPIVIIVTAIPTEAPQVPNPVMQDPVAPYPGSSPIMWSAFTPLPSESSLERREFQADGVFLVPWQGQPDMQMLIVDGSFGDGCQELRVQIYPPDKNNVIYVELYTPYDPAWICTRNMRYFTEHVATFHGGYYVYVNGKQVDNGMGWPLIAP